ncbi:MAG: hypothetical protein KAQ71_11720 [Desulfobulbaceae bacterium]|nr:hypothetical protein [Desulfobulbaceae bacterium]
MNILFGISSLKRSGLIIFLLLFAPALFSNQSFANNSPASQKELIASVAKLQLGFGDYSICTILSKEQVAAAQKNLVADSYPGTYKFKDNDIYVVADNANNMILALYKRQEKVDREQMKRIISMLMTRFEEPTTMAHDKLVYWAYNQNGKISEETYQDAKQTGKLNVIATVKLNSTGGIFPDKTTGSPEGSPESEVEEQPLADIYTLVSSQPLLEGFIRQQ